MPSDLLAARGSLRVTPLFERRRNARFHFDGPTGQRLEANLNHWLLTAPAANPAMLQIFRDRDHASRRDLLLWTAYHLCEFATAGATGTRYVSWLPAR